FLTSHALFRRYYVILPPASCPHWTAASEVGRASSSPSCSWPRMRPAPTKTLALNCKTSDKNAGFVRKDLKNLLKPQCRADLWVTRVVAVPSAEDAAFTAENRHFQGQPVGD